MMIRRKRSLMRLRPGVFAVLFCGLLLVSISRDKPPPPTFPEIALVTAAAAEEEHLQVRDNTVNSNNNNSNYDERKAKEKDMPFINSPHHNVNDKGSSSSSLSTAVGRDAKGKDDFDESHKQKPQSPAIHNDNRQKSSSLVNVDGIVPSVVKRSNTTLSSGSGSALEFVHIPKTGGTSIEYVGASHGIAWSRCHYAVKVARLPCPSNQIYRYYNTDYVLVTPKDEQWAPFWHIPPKYFVMEEKATLLPTRVNPYPPTTPLFAVVRNPYTRIISEWYFEIQKHQRHTAGPETYNNAIPFNAYITEKLEIFINATAASAADHKNNNHPTSSFGDDPTNTDMRVERNVYWMHDAHFIPQYEFIYDNHDRQLVHHVLKFESLKRDFTNLMKQFGLQHLTMEEERNVSKDKKLSMVNITAKNRALIHKVYRRDFEAFGYTMHE